MNKPKHDWSNRPQFKSGDRVILPNGEKGKLTSKYKDYWLVKLPNHNRVPCNEFDLKEAPHD